MGNLTDKLQSYYNSMNPKKQRLAIVTILSVIIVIIGMAGYMSRSAPPVTGSLTEKAETKSLSLDANLLAKTQLAESERQRKEMEENYRKLQARVDNMEKERNADPPIPGSQRSGSILSNQPANRNMLPEQQGESPSLPRPMQPRTGGDLNNFPPVPLPPPQASNRGGGLMQRNTGIQGNQGQGENSNIIGGIEIVENTAAADTGHYKEENNKKKDQGKKVYLPPSFMPGTLLSGLDAPVIESARKDPMPVLIRINDLAVLPNEVKANLRGCFVIAHGFGNLASERAEIKLVSLSCISKKGDAIIDQAVEGYVVDQDGKVGLSGTVVAKLGSLIARSAIAGFFQGVGDFLKASTTTTQVTASGTIQTIDTNKLATAGLGGGMSNAAGNLAKFYDELARMSMPVIEVGATKPLTVVVSVGLDLVIKDKKRVEE